MSSCFGIHLGNSSICLAIHRDGKTDIVANDLGDRVTPAVLGLNDNEWEIGAAAKSAMSRNKPTITNNKRLLNDDVSETDIEAFVKASDCKVLVYDNTVKYELQLPKKIVTLSPEDVTSKLYGKMYSIASQAARMEGELQAVLATPLYWSEVSRQRAMTAAELAGFTVLQVISEPAAAVLAYGIGESKQHEDNYVLVYRLGGSSCDVTIIRVVGGIYYVEKSIHDSTIGGQCLSHDLSDYIASEFHQKWKLDPQESRRSMNKLFHYADDCKRVLSSLSSSHVFIESLCEGVDWSQNVTRARFENLITPKLTAYMNPIHLALADENLKNKVNKIILCGGSMKIPKIQAAVTAILPDAELMIGLSPDEVIAQGCAKQAALLVGLPELNLKGVNIDVECITTPIHAKYFNEDICLFPEGTPIYSEVVLPLRNAMCEDSDKLEISLYECGESETLLGEYSFPKLTKKSNIHAAMNNKEITVKVL